MIEPEGSDSISARRREPVSIDISMVEIASEASWEILSSRDISLIDAPPAAPIADPLIGMVIADRYRILEPLGRGGMGIVYKVEHIRIGKLLAMKLLAGELSSNPDVVRRFKREALAVSRLQSPNTVQVFDFGVSEGLTYLVMELVAGETLGRALRTRGPMPFSRLGKIIVQVCSSLAEAHQKGIVHRDIKPENIMLLSADRGDDVVKVLDFGLAKLREVEGLNEVTSQGTVIGTPSYMAPEQIRGEDVDSRADIYSVGALMYRLLTGHTLFAGASAMTTLHKHLSEIPIPPSDRAPHLGIPPGVSHLVMRALRKDPGARFQRIEELQELLVEEIRAAGSPSVERLLDPAAIQVKSARSLATRDEVDAYERKLRRTRYSAVGIGAVVVAAAGVAAGLLVPRDAPSSGLEIEPNNTAAEATPLALGEAMKGHLAQRIDARHGDRDFYAFDLPASASGVKQIVKIRMTAIPDFATCAMLYRSGFPAAIGQYCVGRPGKDLVIPALSLEPGHYLLSVLQDLDPYGGAQPLIHENISDAYTLVADRAALEPGTEIEPNDAPSSATEIGLSLPCAATIGWARDQDVFCVSPSVSGKIRWKVRAGFRESGVIEATPIRRGEEGAPVRVHPEEGGKIAAADVVSPWKSAAIAEDSQAPRCLRVRLTTDPWSQDRSTGIPAGGSEPYFVEAEAVP